MTLSQEENLEFTKKTVNYAGFGDRYNAAIEAGYKAGKKDIILQPFISPLSETSGIRYRPEIEEGKEKGRYHFKGFEATLVEAKKKPVTHYFSNVASAGMTTENARQALQGATVRHSEYDIRRTPKKYPVYSRIDFSKPATEVGKGYSTITVNADHVPISKLLNLETINSNGQDREKQINSILARLQAGERVPVPIREKINGEMKYSTVYYELNLADSKTMQLRVTDEQGTLLRTPAVDIKNPNIKQTQGLTQEEAKSSKAHETLFKMFNEHDAQQKKGVAIK